MRKLALVLLAGAALGAASTHAKAPEAPLVDGIGGVFIAAENPAALAQWYSDKLGIQLEADSTVDHPYVVFNKDIPQFTVLSFYKAKVKLEPGTAYMVNLRLNSAEKTVARLKQAGVAIEKDEDYPGFGRFIWFRDGEGHLVEAWEPAKPPGR
jgi:predicted enzyme related to lactoylglutathione lyase